MVLRKSSRQTGNATTILSNEQMVNEYFRLISKNDVWGLLKLFSDDAVVYEPFSKVQRGLHAKTAIENFLKVSIMASEGLKKTISFQDRNEDSITAQVVFERGGQLTGKFAFHFVIESIPANFGHKKIKSLKIRFID
jgi:ketosteroid isomerase-like protein